jgi:hypothetical protein
MAANVTVERTLKILGEDGAGLKTMLMANSQTPGPLFYQLPALMRDAFTGV